MNTAVEILVNDKPVKQYYHNGQTYIEARNGTEYFIKIKNSNPYRVMAVVTVDGVNVISGQPQGNDIGQGYIINPQDSTVIKGYRTDLNNVGVFKFCQKGHSYSKEVGLKNNNGVIGVRIYSEDIQKSLNRALDNLNRKSNNDWVYPKYTPPYNPPSNPLEPPYGPLYASSIADDGPHYVQCSYTASSNSAPNFDMGSTWGSKLHDSVAYTDFEIGSFQDEHIIYYDSRGNLENIGIRFVKEKEIHFPKAFGTFATPPKGWRG